jgi:hypothetical protein
MMKALVFDDFGVPEVVYGKLQNLKISRDRSNGSNWVEFC